MADGEDPKPKVPSRAQVFERAPFSEEFFTKENRKEFDNQPAHVRQYLKEVLESKGNLEVAAKRANLQSRINLGESARSELKDFLAQHKMSMPELAEKLLECVEAHTIVRDKHGNTYEGIDLKTRLAAITLILNITGQLNPKAKDQKPKDLDLFSNIEDE